MPSSLESTLEAAILTRTPMILWGPPGVGKTALVHAVARRLALPVETVIASIREPSDFSGLPVIHNGGVALHPPIWAQRLAQAGHGLLFLDELSCCAPATAAALLRIILERVVGDLPLPDGVAVVAAANPPDQAAGGWDLPGPLANRFTHLQFTLDPLTWSDAFPTYWGAPPAVLGLDESAWARQRILVAAFIRRKPVLLLALPKEESARGGAWPSPRTWDAASRHLAACQALQMTGETEALLVAGAVGEGPALELLAYRRELDLPDPEAVLAHPESLVVPERSDRAFAVFAAVTAAVLARNTPARWRAGWTVLSLGAERGQEGVAASSAMTLAAAVPKGATLADAKAAAAFAPLLKAAGLWRTP